jgi:plastocyanin
MKRSLVATLWIAAAAFTPLTMAGPPVDAAGVVNVHVGSFYFEDASVGDDVVRAGVGDQIRFIFDDSGGHNAQVDELGIDTGVQLGGTEFVAGVLTQPGTYELYCKPHRRRGHVTTLVVAGDSPPPTTAAPTTPPTTAPPSSAAPTTASPTTTPPTTSPSPTTTPPTTVAPGARPATSTTTSPSETPATTATTGGDGSSTTTPDPSTEGDSTTAVTEISNAPTGAAQPGSSATDGQPLDGAAASSPDSSPDDPRTESELVAGANTGATGESASAGVEAPSGTLPTGVVTPVRKVWLRSVWVGLLMAIPIAALAAVAARRRPVETD